MTSVLQGAATDQSISGAGNASIYGPAAGQMNRAQNPAYDAGQIAQAVKQALLNSSSLNDIIAEI